MTFTTRFAPSPTGPLHLGHAFSALTAWDRAQRNKGHFLLRIEDIDQTRARPEWEARIYEDLHWLGLSWPRPVMRQSDRLPAYRAALRHLWQQGLIYPCFCNRRDILAAASAPQEGAAPAYGPDGLIYPGTCRHVPTGDFDDIPPTAAIRLNIAKAVQAISDLSLSFMEECATSNVTSFSGTELVTTVGDVVLARREMGTSYHLSVVCDDAAQGITHVSRGEDLFETTKIHVILYKLLEYNAPTYCHHSLIRDENGKRLAKRDDARALCKYREKGATPQDIRKMVGLV